IAACWWRCLCSFAPCPMRHRWKPYATRLLSLTRDRSRSTSRTRRVAKHWAGWRSEEHTSELQSLMRISYAVFCLKKKKQRTQEYIEICCQINIQLNILPQ